MSSFSVSVHPTDPAVPLGLEVWLDNTCVFDCAHVDRVRQITHEFAEDEGNHTIGLVLKNKLPEHTHIDSSGKITQDALLKFDSFMLEDFDCTQVLLDSAQYTHNFNGTGNDVTETFTGVAGCNGKVTLEFSTPVYLWLLESM